MTNFGPVLDGQRFGRWTVIQADAASQGMNRMARCRCDCDTERLVRLTRLRTGKAQACVRYSQPDRSAPDRAARDRAAQLMAELVTAELGRLEESISRMRARQAELRALREVVLAGGPAGAMPARERRHAEPGRARNAAGNELIEAAIHTALDRKGIPREGRAVTVTKEFITVDLPPGWTMEGPA